MNQPAKPAQAQAAKPWYTIRMHAPVAAAVLALAAGAAGAAPVQNTAEIFIYGDIGESWWGESVTASQFVRDLAALKADAITIRINSYGGSVVDGIAIHNAIKRHPAPTTVTVDGFAASIASLIAMAGDVREISENAMMMLHAPWGGVAGNAVEMREYADMLDKWSESMATSYASASGRPVAEVLAMLKDGKDHWYTAAEAQAAGLVHTVVASLPEAANAMAAFDLTRYRTVPALLAQRKPVAAVAAGIPPVATATNPLENNLMPGTNTAVPANPANPATPDIQAATDAAVASALRADSQRRAGISASFAKFSATTGVTALQQACEADTTCTVQAAGEKLLALLGSTAQPVAGHLPGIQTVADERDKRIDAMVQAVLARAGVRDDKGLPVRASKDNPYRGAKMIDLARASLPESQRHASYDQMNVFAAAFTQSTSDFPILLENVLHKSLQSGYALAKDTWSLFCARGSVSDFRPHKRYRVGSLSNLEALTELGEFRNKSIPDGERSSITATTKGNLINISRQTMINDDLAAFVGLSQAMGRAAKRTIEADAWALVASNPTLEDGTALYHSSRGNLLASGTVVSVASIALVRQAMAIQKDVGGNDYLNLMPSIWLGPTALGDLVREVTGAEFNDDTSKNQRKPNTVRNIYRTIVDTPYLGGTAWYSLADPMEAPVYEVAFLDGNDTPYVEFQNGFEVDGAVGKVRLDYAVGALDGRGGYKNPGA